METNFVEIGNRIAKRRIMLNLTQERLAEKSGLSTTFIGHIERATTKCSIETLMKICTVLKVTPDFLLLGVDDKADDYFFEEFKMEVLRCEKRKQKHLMSYIKWLSEQDI